MPAAPKTLKDAKKEMRTFQQMWYLAHKDLDCFWSTTGVRATHGKVVPRLNDNEVPDPEENKGESPVSEGGVCRKTLMAAKNQFTMMTGHGPGLGLHMQSMSPQELKG